MENMKKKVLDSHTLNNRQESHETMIEQFAKSLKTYFIRKKSVYTVMVCMVKIHVARILWTLGDSDIHGI